MTQTTRSDRPAQRPADRLPRLSTSLDRGREIRYGVLGAIGILLLVVGVPVALAVFVGYPLPRSAPSRDWLTQTVDATLIIKILACVVWVLWAHFTVCIIAEWRALRRGRLPRDLAFGGSSQALARRLVAAALLLAGAATTFGGLTSGGGAPQTAQTRVVAGQAAGAHAAARTPGGAAEQGRSSDRGVVATPLAGHAQVVKTYVVEPASGRHYDCLWDIAGRTLGDPRRYHEIFELNKDRVQADGSKLIDANLIRPGWQLRLPGDASGPGVHTAPARAAAGADSTASTAATASTTTPATGATTAAPAVATRSGAHAATTPGTGSAPGVAAASKPAADASSWASGLLGGGLMLAGVALALSARRGPYGLGDDDAQALDLAADVGLAMSLDRALRNLAASRQDQGRELPQPVLAWVTPESVTLALAGGDTAQPPLPWRVEAAGVWTCTLVDVVDHPRLSQTSAPFPGLLSIGRDGEQPTGSEVFVDFEQAPGIVGVGGDVTRARDLVTGLAAQAVTSVWSDGATATLVGFGDNDRLADLDPRSIAQTATLSTVLDGLERDRDEVARLQERLGVDGILNGRQARRADAWQPHVIVLSGPPTNEEVQRLRTLTGDGRSQFVVLMVGDSLHAAWRFVVDADGGLDLGALGTTVVAHRLDRRTLGGLVELMRAARTAAGRDADAVGALTPADALAEVGARPPAAGADGAAAAGASSGAGLAVRAHRPAQRAAAVATVSVLGPVGVEAPGPVPAAKRELLTEIVVAVALAPDGLHEAVLRSAIWPRGVSDDVYRAALRDTVNWLGADAAGEPVLRELNGRWLLGPGAWLDWEQLQVLVAQAAAGTGRADELGSYLAGIDLFHGAGFSGTPAGRYRWLAFRRAVRDANVVATAVVRRAAGLLLDAHRPADAEEALRRGLALVPTAEVLWRDLLSLTGSRGPDAAAQTAADMYDTLRMHGAWPEPQTDALVAQLAPGRKPETA